MPVPSCRFTGTGQKWMDVNGGGRAPRCGAGGAQRSKGRGEGGPTGRVGAGGIGANPRSALLRVSTPMSPCPASCGGPGRGQQRRDSSLQGPSHRRGQGPERGRRVCSRGQKHPRCADEPRTPCRAGWESGAKRKPNKTPRDGEEASQGAGAAWTGARRPELGHWEHLDEQIHCNTAEEGHAREPTRQK